MPLSLLHKRKFSRNLAILAAIFGFCALIWMITMVKMANAAEITQCGTPDPASLETEYNENYCDIYARNLAYAEEDRKFREKIEQRRENFAAPMNESRRNYRDSVDALQSGQFYNP